MKGYTKAGEFAPLTPGLLRVRLLRPEAISIIAALEVLRPALAAAAQAVVDAWDPSGEGGDPELGFGRVCDRVAAVLAEVIAAALGDRVDVLDRGQDGDDHVYPVVVPVDANEVYAFKVDVPPGIYENGRGYHRQKVEGAHIGSEDVIIQPALRYWYVPRASGYGSSA